ncbi:MAG: hypothetical protein MI673_09810 [Thiotrichales bacterium]|nr:hypothetical protein [Thiotrichales bacterium]
MTMLRIASDTMRSGNSVFLCLVIIAACDRTSGEFLPLGQGRTLEYSVKLTINETSTDQRIILSESAGIHYKGQDFYPRYSADASTHYYYQTEQGTFSTRDPDRQGGLLLPHAPAPGQRWQTVTDIHILNSRHETFAGGETFVSVGDTIVLEHEALQQDDRMATGAGKFCPCLKVHARGIVNVEARTSGVEQIVISQTEWYAPGIGLVKRIREESTIPEKIRGSLTQELIDIQ